MKNLLITQCLQNDFVKPLMPGEALPNQLHVGYRESHRLVGSNPQQGPVGRFMQWADSQGQEQLDLIHIRDWHDPNCHEQQNHLVQFGQHCIQNSSGADFIFETTSQHATLINSTTLNDFEGTPLHATLSQLSQHGCAEEKIRVGLIGVWTEAKILFLAYELSTRYPNFTIAVCSALTASSSRSQHFLALQQLSRIVGVRVIDSVGEFIQFLGGEEADRPIAHFNQSLSINYSDPIQQDTEAEQLIRYLFRDCAHINLKILDGGFSGNLVAGVKSVDHQGHEQAPHVIKIGPRNLMAKERTAFEQIETVLGNNAPAIADYADSSHKGGIKYRYASMGGEKTKSLQSCFQTQESLDTIASYLDSVFNEQLGRLYRAAVNDKKDLLSYYCFDSSWAESVKEKIVELVGSCSDTNCLVLPGEKIVYNLYRFYKEELDRMQPIVDDFPFAFVHGDLNGANVMIDAKENVWLIDFFHTHRGHVLKDFAKLENDLLYIYTEINTEEDLYLAYQFSDFIVAMEDPFTGLPELPLCFDGTSFAYTYRALKVLRQLAGQYLPSDSPYRRQQWLIPQLRYAVTYYGL